VLRIIFTQLPERQLNRQCKVFPRLSICNKYDVVTFVKCEVISKTGTKCDLSSKKGSSYLHDFLKEVFAFEKILLEEHIIILIKRAILLNFFPCCSKNEMQYLKMSAISEIKFVHTSRSAFNIF
jgi:hypothetical protein